MRLTPSACSTRVSFGASIPPATAWPPVIATVPLSRILNVIGVPNPTACRTARDAEWANVPSPTFWNRCGGSTMNACAPTHATPSPPICVDITVQSGDRTWHPIPAPPTAPSGTCVERPCGQPLQKKGLRRSSPSTIVSGISRRAGSKTSPSKRSPRHAHERASHEIDIDDAVVGHERRAVAIALAEHVGPIGAVVEQVLDLRLEERPLLLDHDHRGDAAQLRERGVRAPAATPGRACRRGRPCSPDRSR